MKVNRRTKVILAGAGVLLGLSVWKLNPAQESNRLARTQWEYIIVRVEEYDREGQMNKLGAQGWELVHIRRVVETFGLRLRSLLESGITPDIKYEYTFKRPR